MNTIYKKVTGERFVAALIDGFIVGIIATIPVVLYLMKDGFDALMMFYVEGSGILSDDSNYKVFMLITISVETIIGVLYFVFLPFKMNGQTLGKRLMKIKAIDEFGSNPSFKQHFIRSIQNWGTYISVITLFVIYIDVTTYTVVTAVLGSIVGLVTFFAYVMIVVKDDGKGLHDLWADTRVVRVDIDINKEFIEKTTQMSEWATVVDEDGRSEKEDDPWNV